ncbi:MAG: hypothetical protein ABSE63_18010 [Thermoguttaceae bacterium]
MNLTDQTYANIPEAVDAISSGQKPADIAGIYTGGLSDPGVVELSVIARIPDLDAPSQPPKHRRSSGSRTVKTSSTPGRLLGAGLSLNLLIGLGLVLLLGAVAPYVYIKIADNTPSNSGNSIGQAWQPSPPAPTADLAPAWKPAAAQPKSPSQLWPDIAESNVRGSASLSPSDNTVAMEEGKTASDPKLNTSDAANLARRDNNVVQSNITTPFAGPRANETLAADIKSAAGKRSGIIIPPRQGDPVLGPAASGQSSPWPRNADDQANYSPWPNPAHPVFAAADSRRNEPFTADRRNATAPGAALGMPSTPPLDAPGTAQPSSETEAGRAQFDGIINPPPDRNTYERSRPSLH